MKTTTHLFWADDFYIFANTIVESECMFTILTEEIMLLGLSWKESSLQLLVSDPTCVVDNIFCIAGGTTWTIKVVKKMIALGIAIDSSGSSNTAFAHRLTQMIAHFENLSLVLCARRIPLKLRIRRFFETCCRSLLYGAGGWTFTKTLIDKIQHAERRCLRRIFARRQEPGEWWIHYVRRVDALIDRVMEDMQIMPLAAQALCMHFSWAGHIMRLDTQNPCQWVHKWRDAYWLRRCQSEGNQLVLGSARPRMQWGRVLPRWDDLLAELEGLGWMGASQSRKDWISKKLTLTYEAHEKLTKKTHLVRRDGIPLCHISNRIKCDLLHHPDLIITWPLLMQSDNMQVAEQLSGHWAQRDPIHAATIKQAQWLSHAIETQWTVPKWTGHSKYLIHRLRDWNTHADAMANLAFDNQTNEVKFDEDCRKHLHCTDVRIFVAMDGACKGNPGPGSWGVVMYSVCAEHGRQLIASACGCMPHTTNVLMEMNAMIEAYRLFIQFVVFARRNTIEGIDV